MKRKVTNYNRTWEKQFVGNNPGKEKLPVSLKILAESEKALKCTEGLKDSEGVEKSFWLPKSQIEYDEEMLELGKVLEVSIPKWLIDEKGITSA